MKGKQRKKSFLLLLILKFYNTISQKCKRKSFFYPPKQIAINLKRTYLESTIYCMLHILIASVVCIEEGREIWQCLIPLKRSKLIQSEILNKWQYPRNRDFPTIWYFMTNTPECYELWVSETKVQELMLFIKNKSSLTFEN